MAVLLEPIVLSVSAEVPTAVLSRPVVLLLSALSPKKVLPLAVSQPCSQTARACDESAKHGRAMIGVT